MSKRRRMRISISRASLAGSLVLTAAGCATGGSASAPTQSPMRDTPSAAVAGLLAADRGFAAAASETDLITALAKMFATDVVMPAPESRLASGLGEVLRVLQSNPANERSRMQWTPIRGGVSADAQHGFTYGYFTTIRPDGVRIPGKYLAYWTRSASGWRVSAYKRVQRAEGQVSVVERAPALPPRLVVPGDEAARARFGEELAETERAFSRDAQTIGLGPAFVRYAAPDAMNLGGPQSAEILFGPEAIGQGVSSSSTASTITWAPDTVRVATSGDLGVTIGFITITTAGDGTQRVPFFTVWRRDDPGQPWRFVAE